MKLLRSFFLLLFAASLSTAALAQNTQPVTASQVINNAINALGGKAYLQSIKTLYTHISTEMQGRSVTWVTKEMLPNKGAFQIVYNNRIVFQNWFDGKDGFEIVNGEKKPADPAEFKDKHFKKNIINELDYLDTTLYTLEMDGEAKVGADDCYKIKATLANGMVSILYYSKSRYYLLREDKILNKEKDSFSTALFSDYKKFGNLLFYSTMQFGLDGKYQTGKIEKLLVNELITESDFK